MCGIAGIISADPANITQDRLKKMTDAISYRGPDGEGIRIIGDGIAGLGSRRLSIIDLSPAASQPMDYLGRYTIVHNGEIYNYRELRRLLQLKGYSFFSQSDTEIILAAYDHYGSDCLQHFEGMFAFAIWDRRERKLFLARDRMGEKPLFFHRDKEQFLFASEMKALWAAGVKKEINRQLVYNFITLGYTQNPANGFETFYNDIFKLPPRCYLVYQTAGTEKVYRYWDIDPGNGSPLSEKKAVQQFSELLHSSVSRRLRSDVRVGSSLSGGLDSSSIVAAILGQQAPASMRPLLSTRQSNGQNFPTFSAVFPGFEKDESSFIRLMTGHFPVDNYTITPDAGGMVRDFEKLAWHQEEPFSSSSIYTQFKVFELAGQHSVKVLLDGQGADELLAGYHKYYHWYWQELYMTDRKAFTRELQAAKEAGITERWSWKNKLAASLPVYTQSLLKKKNEFRQRKNKEVSRHLIENYGASYYHIPHPGRLNGVLYYNTLMNGLEELLRYADRNSMAHGVEVRLPFLDHHLVQFLFSLPADCKIRAGWTKWLLRTSMQHVLPKEITWRKDKIGYEPPQQAWMQHPLLQEYIREARRNLVRADILSPSVLNKKVQPQDAHAAENYDWRYLTVSACLNSGKTS
jgi:asparagine synthase (glutamine-hydrolysing)